MTGVVHGTNSPRASTLRYSYRSETKCEVFFRVMPVLPLQFIVHTHVHNNIGWLFYTPGYKFITYVTHIIGLDTSRLVTV